MVVVGCTTPPSPLSASARVGCGRSCPGRRSTLLPLPLRTRSRARPVPWSWHRGRLNHARGWQVKEHDCVSLHLFRENAKALRSDALIDKEEFMYKFEDGHNTPYNSTQEKEKLI
jgi:hypothetical protein